MLAKGLLTEIQKALVATPVPASYNDYCSLLHTVSYNLKSLRTKERTEWTSRTPERSTPVEDSTMDWEPTNARTASTKARTKSKDRGKKTLKFRGQCYKCRQDGHMARDCPEDSTDEPLKKSKAAPATRTKKIKTKARVKIEESSESGSEPSEESGKEEL